MIVDRTFAVLGTFTAAILDPFRIFLIDLTKNWTFLLSFLNSLSEVTVLFLTVPKNF
jgi:hypothetical protein